MIKQIKLFNRTPGWSDNCNGPSCIWYLCGDTVQRYFALPEDCDQVLFTAYAQPGMNRVKVELKDKIIHIDGNVESYWQTATEYTLMQLLKEHGTFYVGCEHEQIGILRTTL